MNRQTQLEEVLDDLKKIKISGTFLNVYALDENIVFFESLSTFLKYFRWLFFRAPKVDAFARIDASRKIALELIRLGIHE